MAAFLVNLRHVFYALSFPLHRVTSRLGRTYSTFALCDEAYALTAGGKARSWSGRRILWLQFLLHLYWTAGATVGALLGALVPDGVTGLDFALTALFAVLAIDAVRERRGDLPTPLLALLSTRMPAGIIVILVVYCLRDLPLTQPRVLAPLSALAVTVGLHLWRRNALLSILGGTALHVAVTSTAFAH
ncbi:AzlC family ABC transporter permease [Streptomyces cyaneochromogenes]|nr:AzlC family ABC transporter permease [Streptomyces cyaneochromogenes]